VVLTAREAFQVCDLADQKGLQYVKIGHHYGKNPILKVVGLLRRSTQLLPFALREKPDLALSHGARSQTLICNLLRIPSILISDYEYTRTAPFSHPRWDIVPDALSPEGLPAEVSRVRFYRGIKEDVYVPEFRPSPGLLGEIGAKADKIIITVRPPANEAHYHNPESDVLLLELMKRINEASGIQAILLPRNKAQELKFRRDHPDWFADDKTIVPFGAIDGLDLLWFSDLVVSGGGTMNREAAALGVPVYSIFRGKTGAVDLSLERQNRLVMIHCVNEIWTKIPFVGRDKTKQLESTLRPALFDIIEHIEDIIGIEKIGRIS